MSFTSLEPLPHSGPVPPQQVADEITRAARSSFSLGMNLLSHPRRQAMRAVYAFCRVVDDIADGDPPADTMSSSAKLSLLAEWRLEIDRLYAGQPVSAIGQALLEPVGRYDLPKAEFIAMIEGMETDAAGPVIAPKTEDLMVYIRRVAGSVGCLSMRIFGAYRGAVSDEFAIALANGIQLTNILRDIEEDAEIGRLYLPMEVLKQSEMPPTPADVAIHANLSEVCRIVGGIARKNYAVAEALSAQHGRVALAPARAMMGVYRRYLDLMETRDWQRPAPKMTGPQKLFYGVRAVIAG
ncbi:MAG: squalene/phytoene synthase family protein [Pseudomonadota bacterium]